MDMTLNLQLNSTSTLFENIKSQCLKESIPVPQIFERETLRLLKEGKSAINFYQSKYSHFESWRQMIVLYFFRGVARNENSP